LRFLGERQDLEEMIGNLLDNAGKWAHNEVKIEITPFKPENASNRLLLQIIIDDDGPGLSPTQREQATQRGQRLDESKPGSGLGLSIVADLAAAYGGGLKLDDSPSGGLRATLLLPGF
jgi:signal transduction histidine kinase